MFIIGNPEDTKDAIILYRIRKVSSKLVFSISVFTPIQEQYNEFKDIITETKLENFNQYNLTFNHKNLSKEDGQFKKFSLL